MFISTPTTGRTNSVWLTRWFQLFCCCTASLWYLVLDLLLALKFSLHLCRLSAVRATHSWMNGWLMRLSGWSSVVLFLGTDLVRKSSATSHQLPQATTRYMLRHDMLQVTCYWLHMLGTGLIDWYLFVNGELCVWDVYNMYWWQAKMSNRLIHELLCLGRRSPRGLR